MHLEIVQALLYCHSVNVGLLGRRIGKASDTRIGVFLEEMRL